MTAKYHLELEEVYLAPLPEWAIARTNGEYSLGAQLATCDGRRTGNAHIIGLEQNHDTGGVDYIILTDAGTEIVMDGAELEEFFYPPQFISDVEEVKRKFSARTEPDTICCRLARDTRGWEHSERCINWVLKF